MTLEKWFADAQSGAGQYDIYLLDDPWVPQFGAAEVLEDLGAGGIDGSDGDWIGAMIDAGLVAAARRGRGSRDSRMPLQP